MSVIAPEQLKYSQSHEWIDIIDLTNANVGITDHAQQALGDIVFVELPEIGRVVKAGESCAVIESVKAAADIYAPVSGVIREINQDLVDSPEQINQDAFSSWLFRIEVSNSIEINNLLDAKSYCELAEKSS